MRLFICVQFSLTEEQKGCLWHSSPSYRTRNHKRIHPDTSKGGRAEEGLRSFPRKVFEILEHLSCSLSQFRLVKSPNRSVLPSFFFPFFFNFLSGDDHAETFGNKYFDGEPRKPCTSLYRVTDFLPYFTFWRSTDHLCCSNFRVIFFFFAILVWYWNLKIGSSICLVFFVLKSWLPFWAL